MTAEARWREFQFWYGPRPTVETNYALKKEVIIPLLEKEGIDYAFILDEPKYVLFRSNVAPEVEARILEELRGALARNSSFSQLKVDDYSPEQDARTRITEALGRLKGMAQVPPEIAGPGWGVAGKVGDTWQLRNEDVDDKVRAFVAFMSQVVGRFTVAYVRSMPERVDDRWLKSVFIHLLLNSISTPMRPDGSGEEGEIRAFPAI